jgi:hypothetical protein
MSSLYSLLRKGKILRPMLPDGIDLDGVQAIDKAFRSSASPPDCILVNVQSVYDDLKDDMIPRFLWRQITAATPPFKSMWLEYQTGSHRFAVQSYRLERPYGHMCSFCLWSGLEGHIVGPLEHCQLPLDQFGSIDFEHFAETGVTDNPEKRLVVRELVKPVSEEAHQSIKRLHTAAMGCGLYALMRMNCRNTELRPINEGKCRPHAPNKVVPASVWHEIVITSVPKIRSGGKDIFEKDEHEIRAHWIRGHYADYRKGNGLFGNPKLKGLFWIPEHRKGNEELGQVIPEYTIQ